MVIEDQSVWMSSSGFTSPEPFEVDVKSLAFNKTNKVLINPDKRNIFSSIDILGTAESQCISDGLYCFTTVSCGVTYTINRAYLCNSRCQIDTLISKSDRSNIQSIEEVEFLFKAIEINTNLGKLKVASDLFNVLQSQLEKLGCDSKSCCR